MVAKIVFTAIPNTTAAPYVIFYQSAERTTFMEVQAEPDMIGNYSEM